MTDVHIQHLREKADAHDREINDLDAIVSDMRVALGKIEAHHAADRDWKLAHEKQDEAAHGAVMTAIGEARTESRAAIAAVKEEAALRVKAAEDIAKAQIATQAERTARVKHVVAGLGVLAGIAAPIIAAALGVATPHAPAALPGAATGVSESAPALPAGD